ncbi:MAG: 3-deoxy-8-phosphooctulonate synthase [Alphaproteobacteria bacterium]|jgi:2-dehydro-3-deoxyphosphooctonate aldolase (KDO 8-P synthase)|nr:3-deoxy-8-phosphooctulonate synthase [Alphaproteobacteria bacterium]
MKKISLNGFDIGNNEAFTLIAGPCAAESHEQLVFLATEIKKITDELGINFIFKASFDKANRTTIYNDRGLGLEKTMAAFKEIREKLGIPTTTDMHLPEQAEMIAPYVDIIQIPAFLARQTDLLIAAAKTGKIVSIKSPQFVKKEENGRIAQKVIDSGNEKVMLIERGTFNGDRVFVDPLAFPKLKEFKHPVILDSTHPVQLRDNNGESIGQLQKYVLGLAKLGISQKIAGVFMEVHENPQKAICDRSQQFYLANLKDALIQLKELDNIIKKQPEIKVGM